MDLERTTRRVAHQLGIGGAAHGESSDSEDWQSSKASSGDSEDAEGEAGSEVEEDAADHFSGTSFDADILIPRGRKAMNRPLHPGRTSARDLAAAAAGQRRFERRAEGIVAGATRPVHHVFSKKPGPPRKGHRGRSQSVERSPEEASSPVRRSSSAPASPRHRPRFHPVHESESPQAEILHADLASSSEASEAEPARPAGLPFTTQAERQQQHAAAAHAAPVSKKTSCPVPAPAHVSQKSNSSASDGDGDLPDPFGLGLATGTCSKPQQMRILPSFAVFGSLGPAVPVGINNPPGANLCFLNASAHLLFSSRPFMAWLRSAHSHRFADCPRCKTDTPCLYLKLKALDRAAVAAVRPAVSNEGLESCLSVFFSDYRKHQQQDASAFLDAAIDELATISQACRDAAPSDVTENFADIFRIGLTNAHACSTCSRTLAEETCHWYTLDLPIPKIRKIPRPSIETLLAVHGALEPMDAIAGSPCSSCPPDETDARLKTVVLRLCGTGGLIISLTRGEYTSQGLKKTHRAVQLNKELVIQGVGFAEDHHLKLTAVIHHLGDDLNQGHYRADVLGADDTWRRYDDAKVTVLEQPEAESTTAYVLYYRQVTNPPAPSSLLSEADERASRRWMNPRLSLAALPVPDILVSLLSSVIGESDINASFFVGNLAQRAEIPQRSFHRLGDRQWYDDAILDAAGALVCDRLYNRRSFGFLPVMITKGIVEWTQSSSRLANRAPIPLASPLIQHPINKWARIGGFFNVAGVHWVLIIACLKTAHVYLYDPLETEKTSIGAQLMTGFGEWINAIISVENRTRDVARGAGASPGKRVDTLDFDTTFVSMNADNPKQAAQTNSWDCGPFAVATLMHLSIAGRSLMGPFPFAQKDLRQLRHFIVCCLLLGHLPGDALSPLEFSSDVVATRTFWHPYETALASRDPNAITLFFQPSPHMLWRASYTTPFSKLVRSALKAARTAAKGTGAKLDIDSDSESETSAPADARTLSPRPSAPHREPQDAPLPPVPSKASSRVTRSTAAQHSQRRAPS